MSPRDQIRSDRSRAFRAVPAAVDYDEDDDREVPDLRAKNPLRRPLTRTVKDIATLVGALTAISGYLLGGGRLLIKWAGIARVGDAAAAVEPIVNAQKARDVVVDGKFAAIEKRLKESADAEAAKAQAIQALTRAVRKIRPSASATKELPQ